MKYTQLNKDWDADPNVPEVKCSIEKNSVTVEFYLNYHLYENFHEDDKAKIIFENCYKYAYGSPNEEGYFRGQHRYKYTELPWGEFYLMDTDWETDFPRNHTILNQNPDKSKLHDYIFFFRDSTIECVAESYQIEFILQPK